MNIENISNRKYLVQVKNTIKAIKKENFVLNISENQTNYLRIDTILSNDISKISQFKVTIGNSIFSIDINPQLISNSNYMIMLEIPNISDPYYSEFIGSNKLSIFVVDKYKNILDSQINRLIDINDEDKTISILIQNISLFDNNESMFIENSRLISDLQINFYRSSEGNPGINVNTSSSVDNLQISYKNSTLNLENNIYLFDFDAMSGSLDFIENIQRDIDNQELLFVLNIKLRINNSTLNIEKPIERNTLVNYLSDFYNLYKLSEVSEKINISVQNNLEGKAIRFALEGIENQVLSKVYINDILSNEKSLNIYANKTLNEDNKIIYKDKTIISLIDKENKINVFTEDNETITSLDLYYVNENNIFRKIIKNNNDTSNLLSSSFINNYIYYLEQIRFTYNRSSVDINRGVNNLFRFSSLSFNGQDQLSGLANELGYRADGDATQISFTKMLEKGLYTLEIEVKFNDIVIDNKSFLQTYDELFLDNDSLNNKINQLSFVNISSNPRYSNVYNKISDIFSRSKSKLERLNLLNQFDDFNIILNVSIKPFFDYNITNKYRFSGYDEDIYYNNQVYVIPVSNNSDHEEANRRLNIFINYLRNNIQNYNIINELIGSYLKENLTESEKISLINYLMANVTKDVNNLNETFVISKGDVASALNRQVEVEQPRNVIDSYNLKLLRTTNNTISVIKSNVLIPNEQGNNLYRSISRDNLFSNQNFLAIQTKNSSSNRFYIKCRYFFDIETDSYDMLNSLKYENYKEKIRYKNSYMRHSSNMQYFSEYFSNFENSNVVNINSTTRILIFRMNDLFLFNPRKIKTLLKDVLLFNQIESINLESLILNVELYSSDNMLVDILNTKIYIDEPFIINNKNIDLINFDI